MDAGRQRDIVVRLVSVHFRTGASLLLKERKHSNVWGGCTLDIVIRHS